MPFVVSFCFALMGLALLLLFVRNPDRSTEPVPDAPKISARDAANLVRAPRFRVLLLLESARGLATVSDSFLYLSLQQQLSFSLGAFPLLFVATALVYMVLAVPIGRLADRICRGPVFVAGYVALGISYLTLLLPGVSLLQMAATIGLLSLYCAMTDGVLQALASTLIPEELRGSGLGLLATATGISRLVASVLFGIIWTVVGIQAAVSLFLVGLVVAVALTAALLLAWGRRLSYG